MNYPKMAPEVVKKTIAEGVGHLECVAKLYRKQHNKGRCLGHEQQAGAKSWHHQAILRLQELPGVDVVKADWEFQLLEADVEEPVGRN